MSPRDYVEVDMSAEKELNELDYGQPFIHMGFLCVELDPSTNLIETSILDKEDTTCFCFNTNDLMVINRFSRVQPVRKIGVNVIQL